MENQPPFQSPYQQPSNQPPISLPNATAALVLGIISLVGCFCYGIVGLVCGIIALVLANKDLKLYAADPAAYSSGSYSNLKAGRVCAIVGLSLSALYLIVIIIYIIVVGTAILTHPGDIFQHHYSTTM
jgi:M penetrans paralogue family 26